MPRLLAEIDWLGRNKIEYLTSCDANFAILKRDEDLVDAMIATKAKYGYPKYFRAAFAKNSNDLVLNISRKLHRAGMQKATTLALQSVNEEVLGLIKRKNIRYDKMSELIAQYEAEGIPTYSEIIVGLPGETLTSFIVGLDRLIDAGQHDGISIYLCLLLENTEMNTPEHIAEHGIESVPMKAMLYHGTPEPDVPEEIQVTVVATRTMPRADLRRAVLYGWLIQAFHGLGLTQATARVLRRRGIAYSDFYVPLLDWLLAHPQTVGGHELARVAALWDGACVGESWNAVDSRFGDISWPPEDFLFLNIACETGRFFDEIVEFYESIGARDLLAMQRSIVIQPEGGREEAWARDGVWFGKRGYGKALRLHPVDIEEMA